MDINWLIEIAEGINFKMATGSKIGFCRAAQLLYFQKFSQSFSSWSTISDLKYENVHIGNPELGNAVCT